MDESDKANQASTAGKMENARARLDDAQTRMGAMLLPMYASVMEKTANAFERLNGFMERNPKTGKAMVVGFAGLAASLAVVAPLAWTVGHALSTYAGYAMVMEKLGAATGRNIGVFRGVVGAVKMLGGAFRIVGTAIMFMGRLMMANPILAVVGLIAGAALLIWENWDTLGPKFKGLWGAIKADFQETLDWFGSKFQWVGQAWAKTKALMGFGGGKTDATDNTQPPAGSPAAATPTLPTPKAATGPKTAPQVIDQRKYEVTIHQQPGQSPKDLANAVTTKLGAPAVAGIGSGLYDVGF